MISKLLLAAALAFTPALAAAQSEAEPAAPIYKVGVNA